MTALTLEYMIRLPESKEEILSELLRHWEPLTRISILIKSSCRISQYKGKKRVKVS